MRRFLPIGLMDFGLAMLCLFVLYEAVTSFEKSLVQYHSSMAGQILLISVLMLLPHLIFGSPALDFKSDGWPWTTLIIVLLVSTIFAETSAATEKLRLLFSFFAFGFALRCWLRLASASAVPLILFSMCIFHAVILLVVFQQAPHANPLKPYDHSWVPYHSHIRHVAYHGMVASCAGIALAFLSRRLRMVGFLLAVMALTGIFYFGARGALLGWLVFVVMYALTSRRYRDVLLVSGLAAGLAMAIAYAFSVFFTHSPFTGAIHSRVESVEALVNTTGRIEMWLDTIKAAMQHSWLGYGLDGYRVSRCCLKGSVQPHNTIVQWLMEFGVIGTCAVLWVFWRIIGKRLAQSLSHGRTNPNLTALLSLIAGLFVFGLVDGVFYHAIPLLLFAILCTLLYGAIGSEDLSLKGDATLPDSK